MDQLLKVKEQEPMDTTSIVQVVIVGAIAWLFKRNIAHGEEQKVLATKVEAMSAKLDSTESKVDAMRADMSSGFEELKDEIRAVR